MESYDVLVMGVGGMGSSALYSLAKQGLKVCGVDKHAPPHPLGSTHGETRVVRKGIFEHEDYMPLIERSFELFEELEDTSGKKLLNLCGVLFMADFNSELITTIRTGMSAHKLPYDILHKSDVGNRFPQIHSRHEYALFDHTGGYVNVEACVNEHVFGALRNGADLYVNESVVDWSSTHNGVTVKTNRRELHAQKLIITAGPWAKQELAHIGVPLEVQRRVLVWYDTPHSNEFTPDTFPVFLSQTDYGMFYGFPYIGSGLKVAEHAMSGGETEGPHTLDRVLHTEDESVLLRFINETFPTLEPQHVKHAVCMYTTTPDHNFVVDTHPKYNNVVIAAGFSGHGYKFAPVMGEVLSDLAIKGKTDFAIDFLSATRFE